jgi:hypothetical protein
MMAAVIRQFVPSQRENRGFAHMPGGLRATGDDRDVRQMPDAADQGGDAQQPERCEQQPDFGIVTHARLFSLGVLSNHRLVTANSARHPVLPWEP